MQTVELSWYEYANAAQVGLARFMVSESRQLNHATTLKRSYTERLMDEIQGACGERAYCKMRGHYWDGSINTFHSQADAGTVTEVRSTSCTTGRLIIRDNDSPDRVYVLVTGEPPVMTVHGWIRGHHARRDEWLCNPRKLRPSWFVPQGALTPFA